MGSKPVILLCSCDPGQATLTLHVLVSSCAQWAFDLLTLRVAKFKWDEQRRKWTLMWANPSFISSNSLRNAVPLVLVGSDLWNHLPGDLLKDLSTV